MVNLASFLKKMNHIQEKSKGFASNFASRERKIDEFEVTFNWVTEIT